MMMIDVVVLLEVLFKLSLEIRIGGFVGGRGRMKMGFDVFGRNFRVLLVIVALIVVILILAQIFF